MEPIQLSLMNATPTAIHSERCLWQRHQGAACNYCLDACKLGAVQVASGMLSINDDRCMGCGACLTACPVECYETSDWSERSLLSTTELIKLTSFEVACKNHPAPAVGNEPAPVLRINACLAAISPGLWFELGQKYCIRVRLEYCDECPLQGTRKQTRQAVELAVGWLNNLGMKNQLTIQDIPDNPDETRRRKVISAENPILTRRDFLFGFARSGGPVEKALSSFPLRQDAELQAEKLPPHLPAWLRHLAVAYNSSSGGSDANVGDVSGNASPDEAGEVRVEPVQQTAVLWPTFNVADKCVACGACARYCPSGALSTRVEDGKFQHLFTPGVCVACGLCARVCTTRALSREYTVFSSPFDEHIMAERPVHRCQKCGSPALESSSGLCYWCATEAPMGSLLSSARSYLKHKK